MNNLLPFISSKLPLLLTKLLQQVYLSAGAVLIAMVISIPLGIWIARKGLLKKYVLAFSSVMQTLPSLAVLGFLLPFFGIGIKTALITLVLYAVLPIIRNTVTGLLAIPGDFLEAADGLGFTSWQRLWLVELPLALPVMVAGIRTAAVMSVGIATLAAFIGAGGLGDFIYEGLSLNNTNLILLGAIPAAILALVFDGLIAKIEQYLTAKTKRKLKRSHKKIFIGSIVILMLAAILWPFFTPSSNNQVKIGTKNFTEQFILGELMAQMLQAHSSLQIVKRFNLGGTFISHQALLNKDIDLYPEYTGTAYAVILKQTLARDPQQMYNYLAKVYQQKFNVAWLNMFGFNNTNAVAVRREFAIKHSLQTISDLKKIAYQLTIGVPVDFMERPDGFVGLKNIYHLNFKQVKLMDTGLMYKAIKSKSLDVIMAFSTDGRIAAYNLVILRDDQHLFPNYFAAPLARDEILVRHPEIKTILNKLGGRINNQVMQALNYQVDVLGRVPEEVAKDFLEKNHLIPVSSPSK